MSLASYLAKRGPEFMKYAKDFAVANKAPLAAAAAVPAAIGGYEVAKPHIDDFVTDQALKSIGRNVKRSAVDTLDFAEKHPYTVAALVGGSGMAGAALGEDGFSNAFNAVSPLNMPRRGGKTKR